MGTHVRHVNDSQGDVVDVLYFCSRGCWKDSLVRIPVGTVEEGDASPCAVPDAEVSDSHVLNDSFTYCAGCGVRLNGPEAPVVVSLSGTEYDLEGIALPVPDPYMIARQARAAGEDHGRAAASWYFDGNTPDEAYRRVLVGLEEGNPEVLDTLPSSPLSGEWAGDPTPSSVLADLGVDEDADDEDASAYIDAYCEGFDQASRDEIERVARFQVFTVEPFAWPGGYPIAYVMDDGDVLCAQCVSDPSNPLHLTGDADGWRLEGSLVLEGSEEDHDGPVVCSHCSKVLLSDES